MPLYCMWSEVTKCKADILSVHETHFQIGATPKCSHKDYSNVFLACAQEKKKRGVLLAICNSPAFQLKDSILDTNGHYIILSFDINAKPFTLIALYAPYSHQFSFLCTLSRGVFPLSSMATCYVWGLYLDGGPTNRHQLPLPLAAFLLYVTCYTWKKSMASGDTSMHQRETLQTSLPDTKAIHIKTSLSWTNGNYNKC